MIKLNKIESKIKKKVIQTRRGGRAKDPIINDGTVGEYINLTLHLNFKKALNVNNEILLLI